MISWNLPILFIWSPKLKPTVKNDPKWQFSCYFILIEDVHHQKLGREKCQKFKFLKKQKKTTWKCGVVLEDLFPQRFFKHFQYVYPYWPKCQASGRTLEGSPLARFIIMYFLIQKMSQCPDFLIRTFYFAG